MLLVESFMMPNVLCCEYYIQAFMHPMFLLPIVMLGMKAWVNGPLDRAQKMDIL